MAMRESREDDLGRGPRKSMTCRVNTRLLPLKLFNFFYYGAVGSVIPFLTVYLQHLRVTAPETGAITGVAVLVAFLARPLMGMMADWFQARRLLLMLCCLMFGAAFCSLWFLPSRNQHAQSFLSLRCQLYANNSFNLCSTVFRASVSMNIPCHKTLDVDPRFPQNYRGLKSRMSILVLKLLNDSFNFIKDVKVDSELIAKLNQEPNDEVTVHFQDLELSTEQMYGNFTCFVETFDSRINHSFGVREIAATGSTKSISLLSLEDGNSSGHLRTTQNRPTGEESNSEINSRFSPPIKYTSEPSTDQMCQYHCSRKYKEISLPAYTFDLVFCLALTLISVARSFYSSANSLLDTVTYGLLGSNRHQWGRQRLWGTLGTATVVLVFISVNNHLKGDKFSALFIACCSLTIIACVVGLTLRVTENPSPATSHPANRSRSPRPPVLKNVGRLLGDTAVKVFLVKLLLLGMFCGSAQNFVFWFLRELGASQTVLSTCLLANCLSTVIILRFSSSIIRRLGEMRTMCLALPAYVIRFGLVSVLHEPWLAVPLELLHGVTYSLLWAAASASTHCLAPPASHATCQAVAGAVYWDLGRGLGSLLTGQLFRAIGARWTFRAYAGVAALLLPAFFAFDKCWPLTHHLQQVKVKVEDTTVGDNDAQSAIQAQALLPISTVASTPAAASQFNSTTAPVSVLATASVSSPSSAVLLSGLFTTSSPNVTVQSSGTALQASAALQLL